jgi:tetratricopeptide (TPR) repeat protein
VVLSLALASCGGGSPSTSAHQTPSSVLPALEKAVHEEVSGDEAQAVVDFLAVVKVDPHNQIAWYNLGLIADRNGQATQAVSNYRTALVGDPHYVPALYNLAVLEAPAHPAQAVKLYRQVIRLKPKMAAAHLNLGLALESLGQRAAGKAQIAAALKLDPSLASRLPTGSGAG